MQKLQFSIQIQAPISLVWDKLIAPDSYREWTQPFCEGSYYEGSWEKGAKIRFLAPSGGGMVAVIAENRLHEFISIKHLGFIHQWIEDTESEQIKAWAPAFENYRFSGVDGGTQLDIELDVTPEFMQYMQDCWPKALAKLKEISERAL